jgi:hypothetical protein
LGVNVKSGMAKIPIVFFVPLVGSALWTQESPGTASPLPLGTAPAISNGHFSRPAIVMVIRGGAGNRIYGMLIPTDFLISTGRFMLDGKKNRSEPGTSESNLAFQVR